MDENFNVFLSSVVIGVSIAAPVGPIGLLCFRRTLACGYLAGMVSGLGAASADAIYGMIAGFGLTVISGLLIDYSGLLSVLGGAFLCYLGLRTFFAKPAEIAADAQGSGLLAAYTSTLFLTLTNPLTVLAFVAIFTTLGVVDAGGGRGRAWLIVLGVFSGSALWWLLLSSGASVLARMFRTQLEAGLLRLILTWINRFAGVIIGGFGLYALFR